MAKPATEKRLRAPQGAKRVAQAFFSELDTIKADKQGEVGKAAQAMVREAMAARRAEASAAKAKTRASKAAPPKSRAEIVRARTTRAAAYKAARRGGSNIPDRG